MKCTTHNISSVVMRASHILLICIEVVTVGKWKKGEAGGVSRTVDLNISIQEVLKGKIDEPAGSLIDTKITQWGTGTTRIAGVPGAWSYQTLEAGEKFIVFSRAAGNKVTEMINNPFCELVLLAKESLSDVRLALEMDVPKVSARQITMPAGGETGEVKVPSKLFNEVMNKALLKPDILGVVWAEHLWVKFADEILTVSESFELLMHCIEQVDLSYAARTTLITAVYSKIIATNITLPERINRLAIAMFRLLSIGQTAALHDNLIGVYLPNLLGLTEGMVQRSATEVFRDYEDERQKAEQILLAYKGVASTTDFLKWLRT